MATPEGMVTRPVSLDYAAVTALGHALDVEMALLADVLPSVEAAILAGDDEGPEEEED